jgi:hypothetical protein
LRETPPIESPEATGKDSVALKMMIRKGKEKEFLCRQFNDTLRRIAIIEDSIERNDWYTQMEDLKIYYKDLYNETITIEIPEVEIPYPKNIKQALFSHQNKPENVIVIRDEQDARSLHQEILERRTAETRSEQKSKEKNKKKKKVAKKKPKQIETSSDEYDKLNETETDNDNAEPPFNIENESKEILRASWKNEMEMHEEKTNPRILSRHFKKIRCGLNLVMNRVAALFRMINDTNEEDEEFFQDVYT